MLKDDKLNRLDEGESLFEGAILRQTIATSNVSVINKIHSQDGLLDEIEASRITGLSKSAMRKLKRYGKKPLSLMTADELAHEKRQRIRSTSDDDLCSRRRDKVSRLHTQFFFGNVVVPHVSGYVASEKNAAEYITLNSKTSAFPEDEIRIKVRRIEAKRRV